MKKIKILSFVVCLPLFAAAIFAQDAKQYTAEDYARAEKMLSFSTGPLVDRSGVRAVFTPNGRFWYRVMKPAGVEYVMFDPADGSRQVSDDPARIGIDPSTEMPFGRMQRPANDGRPPVSASPDKSKEIYIVNGNLWVRDVVSQKETQLTRDAVKDFGYATDNAGWKHSDRPIVLWSPDSKKVATFQQDQRHLSEMYLVTTNVGAPKLEAWKYPLPTDEKVAMIHRVIINIETGKVTRLKVEADPHRGTLCDDIACTGAFDDNQWSPDAKTLFFVSSSRDHKNAKFRIADAETGNVTEIFEETVDTQFESGRGTINWRVLPKTNEVIWYSQRSDWGHLYLYDLTNGRLKHQITSGDFVVTQLLKVDEDTRTLYFNANGRETGRDPYFSHFYSIAIDGKGMKLLTPEDGNHQIQISPDGTYFVDNYSAPDVPPVAVVRNMNGELTATLEKADISRLLATGWKPPTRITVRSANDKWDLYGLMFTPTKIEAGKKYPVINYIYPGPQSGSVGSRSFSPARSDHQALAELGFVVILIDGSCNPSRSKSFHDACYGNMAENTLPDQMAGIKQLAEKYPYIDATRVGVWGHSGGGFATAAAMFRYPDFYKVGISESGNHDNRNYEDDWGERYIGLLKKTADGKSDNYDNQANQNFASNLKGKLLLAHGNMDNNVPPYNTYLVVDALIKANKDFDLLIFPNARHGFGGDTYYMMRRRWDYFVKHLIGAEPPKEYVIKPTPDPRMPAR